MANVFDVAAYILSKTDSLPLMKLHKLVYYSQAWSLVWDKAPLFYERIEAWANGVTLPILWEMYKEIFLITVIPEGDSSLLTSDQCATCNAVINFYGDKDSQWLHDLVISEAPWQDARKGLLASERGHVEISHEAMVNYYGSL
ncbi:MAG: DUF4065 domain-containing protein [Rhizonema sp. NSF051]|nr:DUF4065 domain-containing protein [Rhizonema sp. NSF051]